MADDTDTAFGIILFLLFLALIGYAVGGGSWTSSTAGTTTPNPTPIYTTTPGSTTATAKSVSRPWVLLGHPKAVATAQFRSPWCGLK